MASSMKKIDRLEEALDFYQKAEELMPLPDYRENARQAISRIKTRLIETGKAEYVEERLSVWLKF